MHTTNRPARINVAPANPSWLAEVEIAGPALDELRPIWVRRLLVEKRCKTLSLPHRHTYCEFEILAQGAIEQYFEGEKVTRRSGDIFMIGTGVPHWSRIVEYPVEIYVVHFQPWILTDCGSRHDAGRLISRFTARQSPQHRLVHPPLRLRLRLLRAFLEMLGEFENAQFGSELRLHALLVDTLVTLLRWELNSGTTPMDPRSELTWGPVELALRYLHAHYAQPIYARDVAQAARLSESGLEAAFREMLGMPWVRYLQRYRVQQAAALLMETKCNVTEAAFAVGFNSASYFNTAFRSVMGVTPTAYLKGVRSAGN